MSMSPGQGFNPVQANPLRTAGPTCFQFNSVSAGSVTAVQATRNVNAVMTTQSVRVPYNGSVIAIVADSISTNTGSATYVPYVNAIAQNVALVWDQATTGTYATFTPGDASFLAGDLLDVRVSTDSTHLGIAVDIFLFVSFAV